MAFEARGRDVFDKSFVKLQSDPLLFFIASSAKDAFQIIQTQWHIINETLRKEGHPPIAFNTFTKTIREMADCESNGGTHADLAVGFDEENWVPKK